MVRRIRSRIVDSRKQRRLREADALVSSYAAVLEDADHPYLRPETDLPAEKRRVKVALLTVAAARRDQGLIEADDVSVYRNAFTALAAFVDPGWFELDYLVLEPRALREASPDDLSDAAVNFGEKSEDPMWDEVLSEQLILAQEFDSGLEALAAGLRLPELSPGRAAPLFCR